MNRQVLKEIVTDCDECADGDFCPIIIREAIFQKGGSVDVTIYFEANSYEIEERGPRTVKVTFTYDGVTRYTQNPLTLAWEIDKVLGNKGNDLKNPIVNVAELCDLIFD